MFLQVLQVIQKTASLLTRLFVKVDLPKEDPLVTLANSVSKVIIANPSSWYKFGYTRLTIPYSNIDDAIFNLMAMQAQLQQGKPIERLYTTSQTLINYFTTDNGELCTEQELLRYLECIINVVNLLPKESSPIEEVGFTRVRHELKYQLNCLLLVFH